MSQYSCPIFLGCVVTSSNVAERDKIKQIVEKGGLYIIGGFSYSFSLLYFHIECLIVFV